jgi:hypothetical protein
VLAIAGGFIVFNRIQGLGLDMLRAIGRFGLKAAIESTATVLLVIGASVIAALGLGVAAVLAAFLVQSLLVTVWQVRPRPELPGIRARASARGRNGEPARVSAAGREDGRTPVRAFLDQCDAQCAPSPWRRHVAHAPAPGRDPESVFPAYYDSCYATGLAEVMKPWSEVEVTPLFQGGAYFNFALPLRSVYFKYENWACRSSHTNLATHYRIVALR